MVIPLDVWKAKVNVLLNDKLGTPIEVAMEDWSLGNGIVQYA